MSKNTSKLKKGKFPCTQAGCEAPAFTTKQGLGRHLQATHGIAGAQRAAKPKRAYNKKKRAVAEVNFCPCCGFELRLVRMASSLQERLR